MSSIRLSSFVCGLLLFAFAILLIAAPAFAEDKVPATTDRSHAGQFCISCHSANDARLANPLAWNGGSARTSLSPCPTIQQLRWEFIYTGDAFDAIAKANADLVSRGVSTQDLEKRMLARAESFPRLVETEYRSLDAGVNEARMFRFQLNKAYTQAQNERDAWTTNVMILVGVAVTFILFVSFGWGLWNTRHLGFRGFGSFRIGFGTIFFVVIVFVIFALPIFNPPAQSETATSADVERQTALDAAIRAAVSAENESSKAWQLVRLSAVMPPSTRQPAFVTAISATKELETNAEAYWGRARALEESAVGWEKAPEAAVPIVQRIEISASRAWAYAAMADEIATIDSKHATELLNTALVRAHPKRNSDAYFRALDLKKIAVSWAQLDRANSLAVANQIADPLIRAWALREIGQFDQAIASAQKVDDANLRVFALREIAIESQNANLLNDALTVAQTLPEPARAYAFADLAVAWLPFDTGQAKRIANSIAPQFADARVVAFGNIGMFGEAWRETEKLDPSFEQGRAQNEIVAAWARVAPDDALVAAKKIRDPLLGAQAQRAVVAVIAKTDAARALDLARSITIPFVRVQALADVGCVTRNAATFQEAAALADQLRDPYPLRDLTVVWAQVDPKSALVLVDKLDRESDRAQALLAVALALAPSDRAQANVVFDRAVKQAQGARLRGDPFYSTELLREIGLRYAPIDPVKADEAFAAALGAALKVSTAF